jgi:hypothetical protein|tara:strand:- start:149 stop:280 length:132 start_codon:yes stop_codon:yes gene_type:complete
MTNVKEFLSCPSVPLNSINVVAELSATLTQAENATAPPSESPT